jgi:hypothetical protein
MGLLLARMPWNQLKWDNCCDAIISAKANHR